jgi:hypothetical protein
MNREWFAVAIVECCGIGFLFLSRLRDTFQSHEGFGSLALDERAMTDQCQRAGTVPPRRAEVDQDNDNRRSTPHNKQTSLDVGQDWWEVK